MLSLAEEAEQFCGGGGERVGRLGGNACCSLRPPQRHCLCMWMFGGDGGGVSCTGQYHTRSDLTLCAKQQRGWGTKPVYPQVSLAGFQEGLNLGFPNMSLETCRDS